MNWLMYIGGGLLFNFFMYFIYAFIITLPIRNINTEGKVRVTIPPFWFIPYTMIWIWICWKFIT